MSLRCLPGLALLILAFSVSALAQSQSLGDLARQVRAERQQSAAPHPAVITNDDIATTPAPPVKASKQTAQNEADSESPEPAKPANPDQAANENTNVAAKVAESSNSNLKNNSQESEIDRRTAEINQRYLDRIAAIRKQINTAQQELAKLQQEQAANTLEYRRTLGVFPNPGEYVEQQRAFNEQIKAKGELIANLNSELEDAKEAARHAGVPHASDL